MKRLPSNIAFFLACIFSPLMGVLSSAATSADEFDWRNVNGLNFVTPIKDQGGLGVCWSFGQVATIEANYKLTRNDPSFSFDLSEQNMIMGVPTGYTALDYCQASAGSMGICPDAVLPYLAQLTDPDWPLTSDPLMTGPWQTQVVKLTGEVNTGNTVAGIKADIKAYGPLNVAIDPDDLDRETLGNGGAVHDVCIVGYADNSNWAGGGYWIIKTVGDWNLAPPPMGISIWRTAT